MDYQKQIVEFLSAPENLPIALEVSKQLEAVRQALHKSFWIDITQALQNHMKTSQYVNHWDIIFEGGFFEAESACKIYVNNIPKGYKGIFLSLHLAQELSRDEFKLYLGLVWNKDKVNPPKISAFKKLCKKSTESGVPEDPADTYSPVYIYLDIDPRSDEFALEYGLEKEDFIKNLSERIWTYFESIEPELYQLNEELMKS